MNFFIGAHYNLNNGDRAVLEATISSLKEIIPDAQITVSVFDKRKFYDERVNAISWPLKGRIMNKLFELFADRRCYNVLKLLSKFLVNSEYKKELYKADIILMSGGHHLTDILGKDTFYRLSSNFILPILMGKKIVLLPQSIGPIKNDKSESLLLDKIFKGSKYIAYRDSAAENFLKQFNVPCSQEYVPDIVFNFNCKRKAPKNKTVGIALYCVYQGEKLKKLFPFVIDNLYKTLRELGKEGYNINFISMDINDVEVAESLVYKLKNEFSSLEIKVEKPASNKISDVVKLFSDKDLILAYKTHSVVFSIITNTPVVAVAYHPKSIEFMDSVGLKEYAINDTEASFENLNKLVHSALSRSTEIKKVEMNGTLHHKKMIKNYLKKILEMK